MWDDKFISNEELRIIIISNIRKYRKLRGLTQDQLSERIGISHDFYRQIESSKGSNSFSFYTLYKISRVLNVPLDMLVQADNPE